MSENKLSAEEGKGMPEALLGVWDAMEPDEGFVDRVMRAADEARDAEETDPEPDDAPSRFAGWRAVAAVFVAASLGGAGVFAAVYDEDEAEFETEPAPGVAGDEGEPESVCEEAGCAPELGTLPANLEKDIRGYLGGFGHNWGEPFAFSGVVLVARGEQQLSVELGSMGFGRPESIAPGTVFQVGALTQPMVAMAFARFVRDGRLELDQSIGSCGVDVPEAWAQVTLQQLATHRSGIPNFTDSAIYQMKRHQVHDAVELWNYVGGEPLEFEPGARYEPSNSNYVLLGECLATRAGSSLDEVLRTELFEPAQMSTARMGLGPAQASADGMTFDEYELLEPAARVAPSALAGAGGISASALDLLAFHRALRDEKLLTRDEQEPFYKLTHSIGDASGYGMGWTSRLVGGDYELGHPGGLDGFNGVFTRRLHDDTFVAVLMNNDSVDARRIALGVMELVDGREPQRPEEPMERALDPQRVPVVVGRYRLSDKSRKHYRGILDQDALDQMAEVIIEFDDQRLWMRVPEHGRKWMHPEGGDRFFFKDLQATTAVFGMPSDGTPRASFLSLRSGPLEFMLLRSQ